LPAIRSIPIIIKAMPEPKCMYSCGTYLVITEPARTPNSEEAARANADPKKTIHIDFDLAAISMVANCVLSPNSARKIKKKVIRKVFILTPDIPNIFHTHLYYKQVKNMTLPF